MALAFGNLKIPQDVASNPESDADGLFGTVLDTMKEMSNLSLSVSGSEDKSIDCQILGNEEDVKEQEEQSSFLPAIAVNILNIQTTKSEGFAQSDQLNAEIFNESVDVQSKAGQAVKSETNPAQRVASVEEQTVNEVKKSIPERRDDRVITAEKSKPNSEISKNEKQFPDIKKAVFTEEYSGIVKQAGEKAVVSETGIEKMQTVPAVESEESQILKNSKQIVSEQPKTDEKTVQNGVNINYHAESRIQDHISVNKQEVKGLSDVNLDEVVLRLAGPIKKEALSGKDMSFKIKLRPEGLGEVTVDLKHSGDSLSILIKAEFSSTKELIETGLDSLKRALSDTSGQSRLSISLLTVENNQTSFGSAFFESRSNNPGSFSQFDRSNTQRKADAFDRTEKVTETKGAKQTYSKAYRSGMFDYRA